MGDHSSPFPDPKKMATAQLVATVGEARQRIAELNADVERLTAQIETQNEWCAADRTRAEQAEANYLAAAQETRELGDSLVEVEAERDELVRTTVEVLLALMDKDIWITDLMGKDFKFPDQATRYKAVVEAAKEWEEAHRLYRKAMANNTDTVDIASRAALANTALIATVIALTEKETQS